MGTKRTTKDPDALFAAFRQRRAAKSEVTLGEALLVRSQALEAFMAELDELEAELRSDGVSAAEAKRQIDQDRKTIRDAASAAARELNALAGAGEGPDGDAPGRSRRCRRQGGHGGRSEHR